MRNSIVGTGSNKPLLTTHQTAEVLGVSEIFLRASRCKKSLDLPFIRVGGSIRYRREDVEAFIERHREGGVS